MTPNTQKATTIALAYLIACVVRFQSRGEPLSSKVLLILIGVTAVTLALLLTWQAINKSSDWSWWQSFVGLRFVLLRPAVQRSLLRLCYDETMCLMDCRTA